MKPFAKTSLIFLTTSMIVGAPFATIGIWNSFLPKVFDETYLGGLSMKYERLIETDEPKIILVGGSSTAFGFRSDLIEEHLSDYKVVNFGLYGTIGTKAMMDLSKANINKGDIVILTPEMNSQAFSLFFDASTMLQAIDSNWNMFSHLEEKNQKQIVGKFMNFFSNKIQYTTSKKTLNLSGVYQKINIDENGDIAYFERDENGQIKEYIDGTKISLRVYNKMLGMVDPNSPIVLEDAIVNEDFVSYANEYASYVEKKGATIKFAFSPMNAAALQSSEDDVTSFYWLLKNLFDFEILGNPAEYIIEPEYFYDSNYHLNDAGAILRTKLFIDNYKLSIDDFSPTEITIPDKPTIIDDFDPNQPGGPKTEEWFEYENYLDYNGEKKGLSIKSVKSDYLNTEELSIPWAHDGFRIVSIKENAFLNTTNLKIINIPKTIQLIRDEAFSGCSKLETIHLAEELNPGDILIGLDGAMLQGCNPNVKIGVPVSKLGAYSTDYYWSHYAAYLVGY